jgi:hypothetical protein
VKISWEFSRAAKTIGAWLGPFQQFCHLTSWAVTVMLKDKGTYLFVFLYGIVSVGKICQTHVYAPCVIGVNYIHWTDYLVASSEARPGCCPCVCPFRWWNWQIERDFHCCLCMDSYFSLTVDIKTSRSQRCFLRYFGINLPDWSTNSNLFWSTAFFAHCWHDSQRQYFIVSQWNCCDRIMNKH